jgi:predicted MFS family arabinose efflux permease
MSARPSSSQKKFEFTPYQKFVVAVLAFLQFTIILDFMILSPLGAMMMPALKIDPAQFGLVVSVYAFSAGTSGFLAAGFADRFDRKRLLLFFYTGFLIGTLLCALAPTYEFLLGARMVTGLFGGVIGSIVLAITTDLFAFEMRGRVMGTIQSAFAGSQILGIPIGLFLANHFGWHTPFLFIVGVGLVMGVVIALKLQPVRGHLKMHPDKKPLHHLIETISTPKYAQAFATTALLSLGGWMLMPFGSAFSVHNLGVALDKLPLVYMVTGCCAVFTGPMVGRISDAVGKFNMFVFGTCLSIVMVLIYTHLGVTPLIWVIVVNAVMFVGIFSRMIPSQALMSAIPTPTSRGSFMSVSASIQQMAGGVGSYLAGKIVVQEGDGAIQHFDQVGYVVAGASIVTLAMMYLIHRTLPEKDGHLAAPVNSVLSE